MSAPSAVERAFETLRRHLHGQVRRDVSLAPFTTYRLGGPAALLVDLASEEDLGALSRAVLESDLPCLVVGRGSNMLVSDRGYPGIAVRLGAGFRWTRVEGTKIEAGAAVPLPALAQLAQDHELAGFSFAVAIPASLGGAVRMNAGAHGRSTGEVVEWADVYMLEESRIARLGREQLGFAYRSTRLPPSAIVTAAALALERAEAATIREAMQRAREWRRSTQPVSLPNAGSVFKNPPEEAAGRLVERICGKGTRVGGARISEVHANFIVTEPDAAADDVYTLIRRTQRRVKREVGIDLETEVKLVGIFEEAADGTSSR